MDLFKTSLNDIVFEKRNKSYGAYLLRQLYEKHILTALIISFSAFTLAISGPVIYSHLFPHKDVAVKEEVVNVELMEIPSIDPDIPPPPPLPKIEMPKIETIKFVPPVVVEDEKVKEEELPPTQEEVKEAVIADVTQKGDTTLNTGIIDQGKPGGDVLGDTKGEEGFMGVSRDAGFPDMATYIRKHIHYPEIDKRMGVEGKVFVTVTISPEGKLMSAKVTKGINDHFDEEALRVVNTMTQWQPALQNGHAIRRTMKIAINFSLDDLD